MKKVIIFGFSFLALFFGAFFLLDKLGSSSDGVWDDRWYDQVKGLTEDNKNGLYFVTREKENLFEFDIAPVYMHIGPSFLDKKAFFIKKNGELAFDKVFDDAGRFDVCGLAMAEIDGKCGYIDTKGNFVIEPQYSFASNFVNGLAAVYDRDKDKSYLINRKGEKLYEAEGSYEISISNARPGEPVIFSVSHEKSGLADCEGNIIIQPDVYDYIGEIRCGRAIVAKDDKFGIIDMSGNLVIPLEYSNKDDVLFAYNNSGINLTGLYDEYDTVQIHFDITDDDKLVDENGSLLYDKKAYGVFNSGNGRYFVNTKGDKIGITDEYGRFIVKPQFNSVIDGEQPAYSDRSWYRCSLDGYAFCFGDKDNYLVDRNGNFVFNMNDIQKPE